MISENLAWYPLEKMNPCALENLVKKTEEPSPKAKFVKHHVKRMFSSGYVPAFVINCL